MEAGGHQLNFSHLKCRLGKTALDCLLGRLKRETGDICRVARNHSAASDHVAAVGKARQASDKCVVKWLITFDAFSRTVIFKATRSY